MKNLSTLLILGAIGYVAYEMFGMGQTLGTALTFGGAIPKIPGLTGLGCPGCLPTPGLGYIVPGNIYSGYAPNGSSSFPTRAEAAYARRH